MAEEKTREELLKEKLFYKKKNTFAVEENSYKESSFKYSEGYKSFLDASKTEREAVKTSIEMLEADGFCEYNLGDKIEKGGIIILPKNLRKNY